MDKCEFCGYLKGMFWLFTRACLLYKASKNRFLRFILRIYDIGIQFVTRNYRWLQGVTWGEEGLQWVTRGYKGLQGVTMAYKALQGVTRGDRGLQGVTRGYRGLQGNTGS